MMDAVLFAAPAAGVGPDLERQLRTAVDGEVHVLPGADPAEDMRTAAGLARAATGPLLLCTGDLVANDSVLRVLATEPGDRTFALTSSAPGNVTEERGRVTGFGQSGTAFLGALRIAESDLAQAAECCERAAGGGVEALLRELLRSGVAVMVCRIRLLHAERAATASAAVAARAAVAAVNEDKALLRYAVKERDDFFTTYFVSPYSPYLARWAARRGLSPAAVTAGSFALAVFAAGAFATGSRLALVAGAVLLYAGFVLDCVDGQLARYTRRFSAFGGWLDTMADRAKEYLVYAGLAVGADAWWLAVAAMVLQTVRHMTDTWYGHLHDEAVARRAAGATGQDRGGRLGQVSDRVLADAGSVPYWLKRVVGFPIGERWAIIALTAALFDGRVALTVVLVWGGVAFAYTLPLRALRAWKMRVPVMTTVDTVEQRDDGVLVRHVLSLARLKAPLPLAVLAVLAAPIPLAAQYDWISAVVVLGAGLAAGAGHDGPLDWLVPAALRAAEYLFVIGVGVDLIGGGVDAPPPVVFALLFALALRHYDLSARPGRFPAVDGWDGRVVLLAAAATIGLVPQVAAVLAGYLGVMLGVRAATGWGRPRTDATRTTPQLAGKV